MEVRVKDPVSGAEKGSKPERYDLIPSRAMDEVARVYGKGAEKYAERNWEKGYKYGLSIAAIERHISQYKQGHNLDDGEGGDMLHHMAHVVFHALALITYDHYKLGTDDRSELCIPKTGSTQPRVKGSANGADTSPQDSPRNG